MRDRGLVDRRRPDRPASPIGGQSTAPELGRLPPFIRNDDGDYGPVFAITAADAGWLRIEDARDAYRPSDLPRQAIYGGGGWVHGSRVRFQVQSAVGYARPSRRARVVVDTGQNWITDVGSLGQVLDCDGAWAQVRYRVPAYRLVRGSSNGIAWFTNICGEQRTTCDGSAGGR